jgi:hypothetical protein
MDLASARSILDQSLDGSGRVRRLGRGVPDHLRSLSPQPAPASPRQPDVRRPQLTQGPQL